MFNGGKLENIIIKYKSNKDPSNFGILLEYIRVFKGPDGAKYLRIG